jgi:hypothetical protein
VSKFVLRIRPVTYYRIELPYETEDEKISVEGLKAALPTVLRYEVTPCPFKRAFTVEIPEDAMAPRRKKAWRPKDRKDSFLSVPGSNQSSPSEGRSEWLDSASTGDDTDGGATDDSMSLKAAKITTPEASLAGDQSPVFTNKFELPVPPKPTRRSVTEIPQTFTSLRAKFDSSPVPEETLSPEGSLAPEGSNLSRLESVSESSSKLEENLPFKDAPDSHEIPVWKTSAHEDLALPRKTSAQDNTNAPDEPPALYEAPAVHEGTVSNVAPLASGSHEESAVSTGAQAGVIPLSENGPWTELTAQVESQTTETGVSEATLAPNESLPPKNLRALQEISLPNRNIPTNSHCAGQALFPAEPTVAEEICARGVPNLEVPISKTSSILDCEPDLEHDDSFSSTPDSFHSADPTSPSDSISTHSTPEKHPDLSQSTHYTHEPTEYSFPHKLDLSSAHDTSAVNGSPIASQNFVYYEARERSPKASLVIPMGTKTESRPVVKDASSPSDLGHMSTEFRRRAQATRQRDVSPMPPPSAIYQPTRGMEAKSILSKTLALVLVPPISLFIILLHITARIVISPGTSSSPSEPTSRSRSTEKEPTTEDDDFDFPLERETSSEYEDAEFTRKLDPWELD